jgi:DNA-binding CsgD family transcriptional regulator
MHDAAPRPGDQTCRQIIRIGRAARRQSQRLTQSSGPASELAFSQTLRQVQRHALNHASTRAPVLAHVAAPALAPNQFLNPSSSQLMRRWRHARAADDINLIIREMLLPLAPCDYAVGVVSCGPRGTLQLARTWNDAHAPWPEFELDPAAHQEVLRSISASPIPLCWSITSCAREPIAALLGRLNWGWLAAIALRSESTAGTLAVVAGTGVEPLREASWPLLAQLALEAHVKHFELRHLGAAAGARPPGPFDIFTERQHAVFELLARGLPAADIAGQLEISERRVWQHARAGADAVQLPLRAAVAHYARERHGDAP